MTTTFDEVYDEVSLFVRREPFSEDSMYGKRDFLSILNRLTEHHKQNCPAYGKIIRTIHPALTPAHELRDVPFIPVRLFKSLELRSVPLESVVKTMTSSGTSGQQVSKIFLDRNTSMAQTRALTQIIGSIIGKGRHPMLIADTESTAKDRRQFSARAAGIRGFSMFGKDVEFMLNERMDIRVDEVEEFLARHRGQPAFMFGFTYIVWEYICEELARRGERLDLAGGILLHGGGWKKLAALNVDNVTFRKRASEFLGLGKVINYYGMVEQTGSIFPECEHGHLHCSTYADVLVRDPVTMREVPDGTEGVLQLLSALPMSYPGHSILTEDRGYVVGRDDCRCGRKGTTFAVVGRLEDAEIRGCSDTLTT
jgi:phenylacetate-coenzyme A ligase PaaK-like adenylate-forming protein